MPVYQATESAPVNIAVIKSVRDCDTIEETLMGLSQFLDGLITISPGESWSMVISKFIPIVQPSKTATETLGMQCALLRDTLESCMQGRDLAMLPDELKGNIRHLLEGMKNIFKDSPLQEDPMTHFNMNIQKLLEQFWVQNHNIVPHDNLKYIQKDDQTFTRLKQHAINRKLGNLNMSPFAAFDSPEVSEKESCLEGTRIDLLSRIAGWIASDDPSLPPIYVLEGAAGTGKSTIAKTVAERAAGINALGASFFFSRNDKRMTAKTFFPTIASQLACYDKDFAEQITEALLRTSHDVTQMPIEQFSTFIMEPLKEIFAMPGNPILIVIDALDDCELDGANTLLRIFADSIKDMPRLKLFISTRPHVHIRHALDGYYHVNRFWLHDIEKSVVQSDIRLYLDFHLSNSQVRDKLPDLKYPWNPAKKDVEVLIETCGNTFINASTAVKFILDRKRSDPARQLSLLQGVSRHGFYMLDSFYTQILLAAFPDDDPDWFEHYQTVVGSIVALQYPLPCAALSALINLDSDDVIRVLSHLHSLVAPTGRDMTFRIQHKSFQDFLLDPDRCEPKFHINLTKHRLELGKRCLRIMLVHS